MTIDSPWALDPVNPNSNSSFNSIVIAEGVTAPSAVNNALRQLGSFLAQATSYKSADLSASVSTNIAASGTGLYLDVVGAGAITSYGTPAGEQGATAAVLRILQFDSSASVSHGANIKLSGAASRKMQPGDVSGVIHEGSGVWREWVFSPADRTQHAETFGSISASMGRFSHMAAQSASVSAATFTSLSSSVGNFSLLLQAGSSMPGPLLHLQDQKASGTQGGSFTSGSYVTRTLNTEVTDEIGSTLSSNQFTLPAGTYWIQASGPARAVDEHKIRLRNITDGTSTLIGSSAMCGGGFESRSTINGRFTISGTKTFELQHRCTTTNAGQDGLGSDCGFSDTEIYAEVVVWKLA